MRAWDDLTPDQTIRPNGTLVDLTPATYVWLNPEKRPTDVLLTGKRYGTGRSAIGTVIGCRKFYRGRAMWACHQVFDGREVINVDLDQVWRDDMLARTGDEPTVGQPIEHGRDVIPLGISKTGLFRYVGIISHVDTFPRRWAFKTYAAVERKPVGNIYSSRDLEWLPERDGFYSRQHDGIHLGDYAKAKAELEKYRDIVLKRYDVDPL